ALRGTGCKNFLPNSLYSGYFRYVVYSATGRSFMVRSVFGIATLSCMVIFMANAQESNLYETTLRPILEKRCIECHNTGNTKGGVNIDNYKEQARVVKDGAFWLKVLDQIKTREMPPSTEPPLPDNEYQTLVSGIDSVLQSSLRERVPGHVVIRRLSHTEYQYTILDLLGVEFDAKSYFPSDASGGGGFDNQGGALFFTPLKFERYYDAAEQIIGQLRADEEKWRAIVPFDYKQTWWQ